MIRDGVNIENVKVKYNYILECQFLHYTNTSKLHTYIYMHICRERIKTNTYIYI